MNILCRCGTTIESNKKKSVKMKYNKYTAIDFFCGGGGMTCGLRQAGIDVIAGVDFDKEAKYTYEINNPGSIFVEANIRELEEEYFEKRLSVQRIDGIFVFHQTGLLHERLVLRIEHILQQIAFQQPAYP